MKSYMDRPHLLLLLTVHPHTAFSQQTARAGFPSPAQGRGPPYVEYPAPHIPISTPTPPHGTQNTTAGYHHPNPLPCMFAYDEASTFLRDFDTTWEHLGHDHLPLTMFKCYVRCWLFLCWFLLWNKFFFFFPWFAQFVYVTAASAISCSYLLEIISSYLREVLLQET